MPVRSAATVISLFALTVVAGCVPWGQAAPTARLSASPVAPKRTSEATVETPAPVGARDVSSQPVPADQGRLKVTFPSEATPLVGGQSLRVTAYLLSGDSQPVQDAQVQAELYAPNGELFATLPCAQHGQGRYLSDPVQLPLRNAEGTWRVTAHAAWDRDIRARSERTFPGLPSYSERLEGLYGFWIETSDLFAYHVVQADDPSGKYWPYEDGNGGCVILANSFFRGRPYQLFVVLDVHWRKAELPLDEAGATAYVRSLAGPHLRDLIMPPGALAAEPVTLRGQPAWRALGRWESTPENGNPEPGGFIEWDVFRCPASDWLWTVVIATNEAGYLGELRRIRETFQCPTSD